LQKHHHEVVIKHLFSIPLIINLSKSHK
jgi:hypothetical protein